MRATVGQVARDFALGALVGVPAGLLWALTAAPVAVVVADGTATYAEAYPEELAAADLTLGLILVVVGLVLGWRTARSLRRASFAHGGGRILGMLAANLAAAGVAVVAGLWVAGRDSPPADLSGVSDGTVYELPLTVGAWGVLLLGAASSLIVVLAASALSDDAPAEAAGDPPATHLPDDEASALGHDTAAAGSPAAGLPRPGSHLPEDPVSGRSERPGPSSAG